MGLRDYLARRRVEKRIQRRSKKVHAKRKSGPTDFERRMERIGDRSLDVAERVYEETQKRKSYGKQILVERFNRLVGTDTPNAIRALLRDPNAPRNRPKSIPKSKAKINRINMPPPPGSMKIRRRKRR